GQELLDLSEEVTEAVRNGRGEKRFLRLRLEQSRNERRQGRRVTRGGPKHAEHLCGCPGAIGGLEPLEETPERSAGATVQRIRPKARARGRKGAVEVDALGLHIAVEEAREGLDGTQIAGVQIGGASQ